jgi:hypothetical protein
MVLKVHEYRKPQMLRDLEREKKNMMYCMNPAVTIVSFKKAHIGKRSFCQSFTLC